MEQLNTWIPKKKLDFTAGIEFFVKPGDIIKKGSPIYRVFNKRF